MMSDSLAIFTRGAAMLAEATTIQAAKELKDLAITAAEWAKRKGAGEKTIQYCRAYALDAERKMGEMLKKTELQKGGRPAKTADTTSAVSKPPTLKELGLTDRESSEAQILADLPQNEFEDLKAGKTTKEKVKRKVKEKKREAKRKSNREKIKTVPVATDLESVFSTILIDPPWDWGDEGDHDQLGRARPDYATMSVQELMRLPVGRLADTDCHLYLWITNRSLPKGFGLLEEWGFRYITMLTWPKKHYGMGNYFRGQTEHILFGVKGSQPLKRKDAGTLLPNWNRGKDGHSSKPREIHEFIESCSPGPYLEMFGRVERADWIIWGENG